MKIKIELSIILSLILVYCALEYFLFDSTAVFSLLSPNETISFLDATHFFLFALLRIIIYLFLPPYLLTRILFELIKKKIKN